MRHPTSQRPLQQHPLNRINVTLNSRNTTYTSLYFNHLVRFINYFEDDKYYSTVQYYQIILCMGTEFLLLESWMRRTSFSHIILLHVYAHTALCACREACRGRAGSPFTMSPSRLMWMVLAKEPKAGAAHTPQMGYFRVWVPSCKGTTLLVEKTENLLGLELAKPQKKKKASFRGRCKMTGLSGGIPFNILKQSSGHCPDQQAYKLQCISSVRHCHHADTPAGTEQIRTLPQIYSFLKLSLIISSTSRWW